MKAGAWGPNTGQGPHLLPQLQGERLDREASIGPEGPGEVTLCMDDHRNQPRDGGSKGGRGEEGRDT